MSFDVEDQQGLPSSARAWPFAHYLQFSAYVEPQIATAATTVMSVLKITMV